MKKILVSILFIVILFPAVAQESGIRFFHGTWEEAMVKAKKEHKKVFVDFFTEWCGPCLNMALNVFTLPEVGDVYNKNFVCLKIDAEKGEGRELARKFKVSSFPTYIFVDPKSGEMIHRSGSNKPAKDFIADAQGALNPKLSSVYLAKKYASGKYDLDFLCDYLHMKKVSGWRDLKEDFEKIFEMGGELTDANVWNLYKECISDYNNSYLKQISENYDEFVKLFGKEDVDGKLFDLTRYAPVELINSLCDFEGKYYNIKMNELVSLFRNEEMDKAWEMVDQLIQDPKINKEEFVRQLSFYTRINPKHGDDRLSFEQLVKKVRYTRYVAYNAYERDEAYNHYSYALALEYLIQRSIEEGKQIPADLLAAPKYGKAEYDMRHPLLKQKPAYRRPAKRR